MSNPTLTRAADIADSSQGRAAAAVPTNQRATSGSLPLSVQTDVPTFPVTPALSVTGAWLVAGTRVNATGIALVNSQSVGIGVTAVPATSGPLQINPGNSRVLIAF